MQVMVFEKRAFCQIHIVENIELNVDYLLLILSRPVGT